MFADLGREFVRELIEYTLKNEPLGPWHITRHKMYTQLRGQLANEDSPSRRCLAISKSTRLAKILGLEKTEVVAIDFPQCNLLDLAYPDASFDFCLSDQVLEHVEGSPFQAVAESARVLRPGGIAVHTTCLFQGIHRAPGDYWRFTPDALKLLCIQNGLEVRECSGWGNKDIWTYIDLGFRMRRIPKDPEHPIHKLAMRNDPRFPLHTWVVAHKAGSFD